MFQPKPIKFAMLAAASFVALGAAAPASAGAPMAPVAIERAAADRADTEALAADRAVNRWLLGGAAAAALAGLVRLFGWTRIAAALRKAGAMAVAAPAAAARYVGDAVKSPLRSLMVIGGLSIFALTGVGLYDVEWAAGLATGVVLTLAGVAGVRRFGQLSARRSSTINQ